MKMDGQIITTYKLYRVQFRDNCNTTKILKVNNLFAIKIAVMKANCRQEFPEKDIII